MGRRRALPKMLDIYLYPALYIPFILVRIEENNTNFQFQNPLLGFKRQ